MITSYLNLNPVLMKAKRSVRQLLIYAFLQLASVGILTSSAAQSKWGVEAFLGDAYCFNTSLTIKQAGYEDIKLSARYATDSFQQPFYYALRLSHWSNKRSWEIEFIHLKIKLKNTTAEVQNFEISHGYNILTINRAWDIRKAIVRVGLGVVIAHPESIIRDKRFPETGGFNGGYYITGPIIQFGAGKGFRLIGGLFMTLEGKLTAAYAKVPIVDGHAYVPHLGIHGLFGLKYLF
jgi:hypothetical protein